MRLRIWILALLAACGGAESAAEQPSKTADADSAPAASAAPAPERDAALDSAFAAAQALTRGKLGVSAIHVPSGWRIGHNAGEAFPMASTYKLPIALAVLAKVDSGAIPLDLRIPLTPADYRLGPSPVTEDLPAGGGPVPVRRMLESMMMFSDNTATDALMRLAGGPEAVDAHLRARGIQGMRVDRYEGQVFLDYNGVRALPAEWTRENVQRAIEAVPPAERQAARDRFFADVRDTSTPDAMAALLVQVQRGEGISPGSRDVLLDAMRRSPTGARRIRAGVPDRADVADKTGTIGRTTNDVGIVTLPDGTHVALAVFVKDSPRGNADVEPAIAAAARAVYAHFTR